MVKNSKGKLGVDCVFSTEALVYPQADGSVCALLRQANRGVLHVVSPRFENAGLTFEVIAG